MTISGVGSGTNALIGLSAQPGNTAQATTSDGTTAGTSRRDVFSGDFASLLSAVQSGDMNAAQTALQALKTDTQSNGAGYSPTSGGAATAPQSTVGNDLDSLFSAVQSGDASAAKTALSNLQGDLQTAGAHRGGGHHHHHGGGLASLVSTALTDSTQSSTSTTDSSSSSADQTAAIV